GTEAMWVRGCCGWVEEGGAQGREFVARRSCLYATTAVAALICGREEDNAASAPFCSRRVLGRGGLFDRRADPPTTRRCCRGVGSAQSSHAQCTGCALPIR